MLAGVKDATDNYKAPDAKCLSSYTDKDGKA